MNPFCFDKQKDISTRLYLPESMYFIGLLVINIVLWAACFGVFWGYHFDKPLYYDTNLEQWVEKLGFFMYMYSLLCTIVSCFIFSKVAYSVNHRCLKLFKGFIKPTPPNNTIILDWLIKQDDDFTKMAQKTIYWFEFWFTIHWAFYTVTSFLSIALVFDILVKYIQAELNKPSDSAIGFTHIELWLVGLFTLQHCFLFLYPCFKAAAVTVGRESSSRK